MNGSFANNVSRLARAGTSFSQISGQETFQIVSSKKSSVLKKKFNEAVKEIGAQNLESQNLIGIIGKRKPFTEGLWNELERKCPGMKCSPKLYSFFVSKLQNFVKNANKRQRQNQAKKRNISRQTLKPCVTCVKKFEVAGFCCVTAPLEMAQNEKFTALLDLSVRKFEETAEEILGRCKEASISEVSDSLNPDENVEFAPNQSNIDPVPSAWNPSIATAQRIENWVESTVNMVQKNPSLNLNTSSDNNFVRPEIPKETGSCDSVLKMPAQHSQSGNFKRVFDMICNTEESILQEIVRTGNYLEFLQKRISAFNK